MLDVRSFWNFGDPAGSRAKFEALVAETTNREELSELLAQIARSYGLEKQFDQGFVVLDGIEPEGRGIDCVYLERGRLYRSSGQPSEARPWFEKATQSTHDDLKVDALHMLAIISEPDAAEALNLEALGIAVKSQNPFAQRWQASLLNNLAWTYFDNGRIEDAKSMFVKALEFRELGNDKQAIHVAKWCVARCCREQKQHEEANKILLSLLENSDDDGFVYEELAENYFALENVNSADEFAQKALPFIEKEFGIESGRVKRLHEIMQRS